MENFPSAVIVKVGGFVLPRQQRPQQSEEDERRKEALNTVFDCDTATADTPLPPPWINLQKRVSIKHDLAARQLSLQDCIISTVGVDPVCQPLSVLQADGGQRGYKKPCFYRWIITLGKRSACGVRGRSFRKQSLAISGRTCGRLRLRGDEASLFSGGGTDVYPAR